MPRVPCANYPTMLLYFMQLLIAFAIYGACELQTGENYIKQRKNFNIHAINYASFDLRNTNSFKLHSNKMGSQSKSLGQRYNGLKSHSIHFHLKAKNATEKLVNKIR